MIIDGHAHACGTYHSGSRIIKYLDLHGIDMVVIMKKKLKLILLTMVSVVLLTGCQQAKNNKTELSYEKSS